MRRGLQLLLRYNAGHCVVLASDVGAGACVVLASGAGAGTGVFRVVC